MGKCSDVSAWLSGSLFISYNINVFILLDGLKIVIPMIGQKTRLRNHYLIMLLDKSKKSSK